MQMRSPMETGRLPVSIGMRCAVGVTALATIVIGVYPEPFIRSVTGRSELCKRHMWRQC